MVDVVSDGLFSDSAGLAWLDVAYSAARRGSLWLSWVAVDPVHWSPPHLLACSASAGVDAGYVPDGLGLGTAFSSGVEPSF